MEYSDKNLHTCDNFMIDVKHLSDSFVKTIDKKRSLKYFLKQRGK